jgi:hypothetical protein
MAGFDMEGRVNKAKPFIIFKGGPEGTLAKTYI